MTQDVDYMLKRDALILAIRHNELTAALIVLLRSHSTLNQAEYNRNPSYNDSHPAYKAEAKAMEALEKTFELPITEILVERDGVEYLVSVTEQRKGTEKCKARS